MNLNEIIQNEEKERMAYETKTIVTEEGETIADLRKVFEKVQDREDWKNPWAAAVPYQIVGLVLRAVEFFHADKPVIHGIQPLTGKVIMSGRGYQAY